MMPMLVFLHCVALFCHGGLCGTCAARFSCAKVGLTSKGVNGWTCTLMRTSMSGWETRTYICAMLRLH